MRVRDFYRAGGTVIALRRLPLYLRGDRPRRSRVESDLGGSVRPSLLRRTLCYAQERKRRALLLGAGSVTDLVEIIREVVDPDIELVEGPSDHLFAMHKRNAGVDLYWVVNDTPEARTHLLRFKAKGRPEKWEAPTGKRSPLFYESQGNKTLVRLALGPWDAAYVVFDPTGAEQPLALATTNLEEFHVLRADEKQVVVHGRGVPGDKTGYVELQKGNSRYRGEYRSKSAPAARHFERVERHGGSALHRLALCAGARRSHGPGPEGALVRQDRRHGQLESPVACSADALHP